jgi:hypothetical protein
MMIGRLENMDPADQWREDERKKQRRFDIAANFVFLFAVCAIIGVVLFLLAGKANADIQHFITVDGRTEPASCHVLYSDPARTVCVSESWICVHYEETDQTECQVKR